MNCTRLDYTQIEERVMSHISGDADMHTAKAAEMFGIDPLEVSSEQRRYAKAINFGLMYGISEPIKLDYIL